MDADQTWGVVGVLGLHLDAADPKAARAFYSTMTDVLGTRSPEPIRVSARGRDGGGPWTVAFGVTDRDAAVSACVLHGGRDLEETTAEGWRLLEDPHGTRFAVVWADRAGSAPPSEGDIALADLHTRTAAEATDFYAGAFGFTVDVQPDELLDDPSLGTPIDYVKFSARGRHVAGVIDMTSFADPATPDQWIPYFHFPDVDAGIERATALGAWVVVPRMRTPTGAYALLQDPWGALFGVWDAESLGGAALASEA